MTAQHVPHTPLWRRFLSLLQTRLGWIAVGLAGIDLLLTAFTNVVGFVNTDNPQLSLLGASVTWGGDVLIPLVFFTWALSGVDGAVVALIALVRGQERSALVWIAMLPVLPTLLPRGLDFPRPRERTGRYSQVVGNGRAGWPDWRADRVATTPQAREAEITPEGSRAQPGALISVGPGN